MSVANDNARDAALPALLSVDEPPPFRVTHAQGTSPFFLTCDHAGRRIPRRLHDLGVPADDLQRHIAWDIGADAVMAQLAQHLDAFAIAQTYSRLAIDCNRPLDSPTLIVTRSEHTDIPGNVGLSSAQRDQRIAEIFAPYHARTVSELERRRQTGQRTVLVTVHSFTPVYLGQSRPWHVGILYHRDVRLAHALLRVIGADGEWIVGDNQPYAVSDTSDYAIPVYGEQRGLAHVELEIRQDLIAEPAGQSAWAERVAEWLRRAARSAELI